MSETDQLTAAAGPLPGPEPFIHRARVSWGDCDPARIAYTARIPHFALDAIDAWWDHHVGLDWFKLNVDHGIGTPFVHLDVDFRSPVTPRAPLDCAVSFIRLGESSTGFRVEGRQDGTLCFEGTFVSVFIDGKSFRRIPVPAHIRAAIRSLLVAGRD